jgi:SAM-dependent methyltransferase
MIEPKETIYGSRNRLEWFKQFIHKEHVVVDIGCGTGSMITIPLIAQGYKVLGLDLDEKSIDYGKNILKSYYLDPDRLQCKNFERLNLEPDVVILSEVLEHIPSQELDKLVASVFAKLKPGGILLVTVPNGYGWFELESFLWYKLKLGWFLEKIYFVEGMIILKNKLVGNTIAPHPSSLDTSGHVQRFTYFSIEKKLKKHGFSLIKKRGGTLVSGPLTNLLFTGFKFPMYLNLILGKFGKAISSDFYIAVKK